MDVLTCLYKYCMVPVSSGTERFCRVFLLGRANSALPQSVRFFPPMNNETNISAALLGQRIVGPTGT
jgi:hypothetical protein